MLYAQEVEDSRLRKNNREVKRARTDERNYSKGKFKGQMDQDSRRGFTTKATLVVQGSIKIGCPTLNLKEEIVVDLLS